MRRRSVFGVLLALLSACLPPPYATPLEVDFAANCTRADVRVIATGISARHGVPNASRVLAAVLDTPGASSYWALVLDTEETGVTLQHVDAMGMVDQVGDVASTTGFAIRDLSLRAGPDPGEVWLIHDDGGGAFEVWRMSHPTPGPGLVQRGWFGDVPGTDSFDCEGDPGQFDAPCGPETWARDLAFVDGRPHVMAVQRRGGPEPLTTVVLRRILVGTGDLGPGDESRFAFPRPCSENGDVTVEDMTPDGGSSSMCRPGTRYGAITLLGIQQIPSEETWSMFLLRDVMFDLTTLAATELVKITVAFTEINHLNGTLRPESDLDVEIVPDPIHSSVVLDSSGLYLLVPTDGEPSEPEAQIFRIIDDITRGRRPLFDPLVLPVDMLTKDTTLLQLDDDVALGRIDDGRWVITKLFPDVPSRSEETIYAATWPIVQVTDAGAGGFLVHRQDGDADLVRLVCAE